MKPATDRKPVFHSLEEIMEALPDEQAAIDTFTAIRWKRGKFCPHCGCPKIYHFTDRRTHKCGECRRRFSIKIGTSFEGSKVGLREWLLAIWLVAGSDRPPTSVQLARDIGVTQKTAWHMLQRLRKVKWSRHLGQFGR